MYGKVNRPSKLKIQKQSEDNIIKSIRNIFKLKKENETIKDRIIRDIKILFEHEDDYYKPIRAEHFWNYNIEYESNSDRNKNLSVNEYLNEIKPYLTDIINYLQMSGNWKVQLTIAINFISSKDIDEEPAMHLKSDNTEFMTYENVNDVDELFETLLSRYQIGLETLMKGSDFIFVSNQLSNYKFNKVNFKLGGAYIESPDWIKTRKQQ